MPAYGCPVRLVSVDPTTLDRRTTRDGRRGLLALRRALPAALMRCLDSTQLWPSVELSVSNDRGRIERGEPLREGRLWRVGE